jgi:methyl-accepting chemotaxis protein
MQAVIMLAMFLTVRKAARSIREQAEELRSSVMPIIYNSRELITRLSPKFEAAAADLAGAANDLAELSHSLRVQTADIESAVAGIVDKVDRQSSRLDAMFSSTLDAVDRAGGFVAQAISRPVRQISGVLASAKAIVESLRSSRVTRRTNGHGD